MPRTLLLSLALLALGSSAARAAEGDMLIPVSLLTTQPVTMEGSSKVVAYGPVAVSPQVRQAKGPIYMYIDGMTFGGHAGSVEMYLAFPKKGAGKTARVKVDPADYVGGSGSMEDEHAEPVTRIEEINDFEVKESGAKFRARTHLQKATEVFVVMVHPSDNFKFQRVVISTEPPEKHPVFLEQLKK